MNSKPVIGTVEELLLILQIWMFGHLSPSSPAHGETVQSRRLTTTGKPGWSRAYDEPDRKIAMLISTMNDVPGTR